jgi:tetratricopeptide (TPR) repeat protein
MKNLSSNNKFLGLVFLLLASTVTAGVSNIQTPEDKILSKAFSAYMDGNDKMALSYFEEVARINPKNQAAQRGLDKVKVRMRKKEDVERAKMRKLADAKMKEGKNLLRSGDVIAAIDSFHAATDAVLDHKAATSELKKIRKDTAHLLKKQNFNPSEWAFARGTLAYLDRDWAKAYRIWSERKQVEPTSVQLANATARAENNFKHMMVGEQEDFFRRSARAFYEQGLYQQSLNSWVKVMDLRSDDVEAMEGKARAEEGVLRIAGKNKTSELQALLEEALEYYANQRWTQALEAFKKINQMDPEFAAATERGVIVCPAIPKEFGRPRWGFWPPTRSAPPPDSWTPPPRRRWGWRSVFDLSPPCSRTECPGSPTSNAHRWCAGDELPGGNTPCRPTPLFGPTAPDAGPGWRA